MADDLREMTKPEARWWAEFRALMRRMPKNLELDVMHGSILVAPAGSRDAYFAKHGDHDNPPSIDSIRTPRVYPNSESM